MNLWEESAVFPYRRSDFEFITWKWRVLVYFAVRFKVRWPELLLRYWHCLFDNLHVTYGSIATSCAGVYIVWQ